MKPCIQALCRGHAVSTSIHGKSIISINWNFKIIIMDLNIIYSRKLFLKWWWRKQSCYYVSLPASCGHNGMKTQNFNGGGLDNVMVSLIWYAVYTRARAVSGKEHGIAWPCHVFRKMIHVAANISGGLYREIYENFDACAYSVYQALFPPPPQRAWVQG